MPNLSPITMTFASEGGPLGHVVDHPIITTEGGTVLLSQHMIMLVFCTLVLFWVLVRSAKAIGTGSESEGNDRYITRGYLAQFVELIIVYLRDQMIRPVIGEKATKQYLPFLLTVFFFILMNNLMGLIPFADVYHLFHIEKLFGGKTIFGGTATANLAVTGGLAFISMIMIQIHAFRELGIKGWSHHLLGGAPWWLFPIMVPVELAGHIIKPAALAIRLLANMVAGHTLLATLLGFGLTAAPRQYGCVGYFRYLTCLGSLCLRDFLP